MMYGIGNEKDYHLIEHFAKLIHKTPEQIEMEEKCKAIAKKQKAVTDNIEILYAGLVGYFWEIKQEDYETFKKIIKPFENSLSDKGREFLKSLDNIVINKDMKKGCPLLLKIVKEAVLQEEDSGKGADFYSMPVPSAYFMPECGTTQ
ncbi:MAG: hypothetical protein N3D84_03425 [Candidatus Woesearchaeota archaeon]|nr:hypothetical protein [Candidatus Woesearchaeota archaeon]